MRIVGLLSGGKDSCYSLMQAVKYGHTIVALANMRPQHDGEDECESFMFQTIGHNVLQDMALCMGVPFFSSKLLGSSVDTSLQYSSTSGDEVEDLYGLLARIQRELPGGFDAVSSGAILSSYQRLRVEHVCGRLGLVSLAYLWQRDQADLLDDMVAHGVQAVLVKVASMGLEPRKHLGKELGELREHLHKINKAYGVHICGEGGEYETFTLDCPLFRRRIVLDDTEMVGDLRTNIAPVAVLRIKKWHLEDKIGHDPIAACQEMELTRTKPNTVATSTKSASSEEEKQQQQKDSEDSSSSNIEATFATAAAGSESVPTVVFPDANVVGDYCFVAIAASGSGSGAEASAAASLAALSIAPSSSSTTTAAPAAATTVVPAAASSSPSPAAAPLSPVATALTDCVNHVSAVLAARSFSGGLSDVFYVQLFLSSLLTDFGQANAQYLRLFPMHEAPSRACVQLAAPSSVESAEADQEANVSMDCLASRLKRSVLHVQSISEWAPACIGPYSQATKLPPFLWLAGQIGLDAGRMSLVPDAAAQCRLAMGHCGAVLDAEESSFGSVNSAVAFWQHRFWKDQPAQIKGQIIPQMKTIMHAPSKAEARDEEEAAFSSYAIPPPPRAALIHIVLPTLPRDALVEVQLVAATTRAAGSSSGNAAAAALTHRTHILQGADSDPISCRVSSSFTRGSNASIWSSIVLAPSASSSSSSSVATSLSLPNACELLLRGFDEAIKAANISWSNVLVFRVYVPASLCLRHVRSVLHSALSLRVGTDGGPATLPAVSFMRVAGLAVEATTSSPAAASTAANAPLLVSSLLTAHIVLLHSEATAAAAASATVESA